MNSRLIVRLPSRDLELASRVEDVTGDDTLAIAMPTNAGQPVPLQPGTRVELEWVGEFGPARVGAEVGEEAGLRVPAILVHPDGEASVEQRRDFVRVGTLLEAAIEPRSGGDCLGVTVVDISGGGLRVRVPEGEALEAGSLVRVTLQLPAGEVRVDASVVREVEPNMYGLRFEAIDPATRERVIQHVFDRQRRELQIRRESGELRRAS